MPPAVADDAGLLERMGDDRNRVALHADHLRQKFLGQRQRFAVARSRARNSQRDSRASTECEALHAADCWASAISACSWRATTASQSDTAIGGRAKIRSVEDGGGARQHHDRVVSDISLSSAAAAPNTLSRPIVATSTDMSFRKANHHRDGAAVRQIDMRQRRAGFNQDSFPDQFDEFEMRAQRLEFCRRQGLQQLIGRKGGLRA